jgi:hypothetical protein
MAAQAHQVEFALTPGQIQSHVIIDYSTQVGRKQYKDASAELKTLHDLSAGNLRDFLKLLGQRADIYGWNDILEIPNEADDDYIHMLKQYGSVSLRQVQEHARKYIQVHCRAAQDSQQLADCILSSLTVEARNTITLYDDEYTIQGKVSGTCLLKVVIRESHIDTNATTRILREELNKLDSYMVSIDSDISKFNEHVKDILEKLHARGQTTHDLLSNLFRAYKVVSDKDFVAYMNKKKDEYDEGQDISPSQLMLLAQNKFKTKKQDNEWNAPSEEQEQIIALRAQVEKLQKYKSKSKDETPKVTNAKNNKKKSYRKAKWMLLAPKEGGSHDKTVNGKEYHWCPKHEAWVRHLPSNCEGKGYYSKRKWRENIQTNRNTAESSEPTNKKLKIANALLSVLQQDE